MRNVQWSDTSRRPTWKDRPFILFTVIMLLKLALVWGVVFRADGSSIWMMLGTGLASTWVVFSLVEMVLYKKKLGAYLFFDLIFTIIYFAVIMYYKYFGVIVTYHELRQVNQVSEVNNSVISLMDPYYLLIFIDIVALVIGLIASKRLRAWGRSLAVRGRTSGYAAGFIVMAAVCAFCIWPNRAIMNEFKQAEGMGLLNYQAYVAFAADKTADVDPSTINQDAINSLKGITPPAAPQYWQAEQGKNLIIIQLEAFQNFLIDLKIDGQEVTPNMNKLAHEHFYFPNFYQQVGQGNTADAEYVVNTSLVVPPNGAASEVYANKELPSMPKRLTEAGYQTASFHTNNIKFWNRAELYKALGWGTYYDDHFFGKDDPVAFGSSDEVLYAKTSAELANLQKNGPFYAQLISMSGHHPFNIPARKYKMQLPKRYEGTLVGDYIRAQNYADYALGQFIDELKANGLWDNSVIVLYGDHQGLPVYSLDKKEKALMKEIYGRDYEVPDMMNIPLIISAPGIAPQVVQQTGAQSDIFPTVSNLLGVSLDNQIHFGQDLLNTTSNLMPERYYLPTGSFISNKGTYVPGESFADGTLYPFGGGKLANKDVTEDEYNRVHQLVSMADRYVADLPDRKNEKK
ncbi:LTA synthase family protein [Paenibacillus protaetiae]|uniref:LTA synthase family protein n=1 Tax=Paenibacillus protaetiae TaxID=2509456 RepID=A0A4P6EYY1_9BACL|nr:LTA synthase family protein [Paenibacillus protaetiae]QAY67965.1 LTA synthase family protein [Paenibacillus protaetiae]